MIMKKANQPNHAMAGVFVFLLLGVFAVSGTVMVLLGAGAYRSSGERADRHNTDRIIASFVRSMVRSSDEAGAVTAEEDAGIQTVTLAYDDGEDVYLTRLYVYDGMLRERLYTAGEAFEPEMGNEICAAQAMQARIDRDVLHVRIQNDLGEWIDVDVALRAGAQGVME